MENEKNIFASLTKWFAKSCDGDWEHENQIKIQTTSNPGWLIEIDILQTEYKQLEIDKTMHVNENNWYFIYTKNGKIIATGDINKLQTLIEEINEIFESNSSLLNLD